MSDDTQPTSAQASAEAPAPVGPPPPPAHPAAYAAPPADRPRLRDRLFGLRALVAVALAGVVLGGLAGFGLHAATDGDRDERFGPGFRVGPGGGPPGPGQGTGPGPGQGRPPQGP